ncbi:dodecenoyl-CoA isomerase [Coemansia sp. Benny D115]|nr:dodecenoyl-CoA isomerase [Coemansia sp. Benny D115]
MHRGLLARVPVAFGAAAARTMTTAAGIHGNPPPGIHVAFTEFKSVGCLATITMNSPGANTFDLPALQALDSAVAQAEARGDVRALVLTSAVDGFFSGGFNLPVLQRISRPDFLALWGMGKQVFRRILALPVPSVAAIDGHALGLGCVMAMACQHRFMVQSPRRIGLNEVAVGMPVPDWLAVRFRDLTSPRTAEEMLPVGATATASEAHAVGLVDRLCASRADLDAAVAEHLRQRCAVPPPAQAATLQALRRSFLEYFDAESARDNERFWAALSHPDTQQAIDRAIAQLAARRRGKK